jgi:hypothetical protein
MKKASKRENRRRPIAAPFPKRGAGMFVSGLLATALTSSPAVAVSPAPPPPEFFVTPTTGEALWADCGASSSGRIPLACSAYVAGALDGVALAAPGQRLCPTAPVRADELAEVVRRYIAAHPQSRAIAAAAVVTAALGSAYPCRPGEQR